MNLLALQLVTYQGAGYVDRTMSIHFASYAVVSQQIQDICIFSNLDVPFRRLTCSERILTNQMMSEISEMTLANPAQTCSESLVFQTLHMSLRHGLPKAGLRCTWLLPTAAWRWRSSWWRWRRWRCKTKTVGGLSCRVAVDSTVDLWPWCFVVGFTLVASPNSRCRSSDRMLSHRILIGIHPRLGRESWYRCSHIALAMSSSFRIEKYVILPKTSRLLCLDPA